MKGDAVHQNQADGPKTKGKAVKATTEPTVEVKNSSNAEAKPLQGRVIGIAHRIKKKKNQDARPTLVVIMDPATRSFTSHKLETEQEELDFLNGQSPVKWREVSTSEDISALPGHQVIFRASVDEDTLVTRHASQCLYMTTKGAAGAPHVQTLVEVAEKVPCQWVGIQTGDTVAMTLGGSGDYFAFALSRKLEKMQGSVLRIPPFKLKKAREDELKDVDARVLAELVLESCDSFYETHVRDRGIIRLRHLYRERMDVMKSRIACEQRLFQRHIGLTFCNEEGLFPEGSISKQFAERKANDNILQAILKEESLTDKKLQEAVEDLNVWDEVFEPIPGVGPKIAARFINAIIDIRRFERPAQLVKFLGVHVLADGRFARHRGGENCNWHPDGRQALYLLADQFNRQLNKDTKWGNYLRDTKERLRAKHPTPILVDGKKRYTKGHIHKMAIWRTLTRFTEWLHGEWWKLERSTAKASSQE